MSMRTVLVPIMTRFDAILEKRAVAPKQRADYKKWLRYFLDFRAGVIGAVFKLSCIYN